VVVLRSRQGKEVMLRIGSMPLTAWENCRGVNGQSDALCGLQTAVPMAGNTLTITSIIARSRVGWNG
jgi:hypothetical protein